MTPSQGLVLPITNSLVFHVKSFGETFSKSQLVKVGITDDVEDWIAINGTVSKGNQPTSAQRPQYVSNGANGLPGIVFDGVNDVLLVTPEITSYPSLLTMFVVCEKSGIVQSYITSSNDSSSAPAFISRFDPGDGEKDLEWFLLAEREVFTATGALTGLNILSVTRDNSGGVDSLIGHLNATEVFNSQATVDITSRSFNAIGGIPGLNFFQGAISEIIMYDRLLSNGERQEVESYLSQQDNISLT